MHSPEVEVQITLWQESLQDPLRDDLLSTGVELPERIFTLAPRVQGEPAFDPAFIQRLADALSLPEEAHRLHPLLERAVRIGLAHIDATFQGEHPRYGVGSYAREHHDGFPPTIIAAVDALTLWNHTPRAEALFAYWLNRFVRSDGQIDYYGPALSEYGQLLTSARRIVERSRSSSGWITAQSPPLQHLADFLRARLTHTGQVSLLFGAPEADTHEDTATYFHNNAWVARGLLDWAFLLENALGAPAEAERVRREVAALRYRLLDAVHAVWSRNSQHWWLSPITETRIDGTFAPPVNRITETWFGSYTNYRYWPELLSSGVLPHELMELVVTARLSYGGQFGGVTRFEDHLDDWPLMDYLEGLWALGRREDYELSLWGHLAFHQAEGHLTAYEQVSFPPGRKVADYCLPCQLVAPRAARRLV